MQFPKTVEEFMEKYKIVDSAQVYTNGAELVPIFRMKQWFEHIGAEPVRYGKWIVEAEDWRHQIEWFKCSCCGFPTSTTYKYCPNCGAKMEGVEK